MSNQNVTSKSSGKMPSIFLAHGSPLLLDDQAWIDELARWAKAMPRPKAILMISAHWVDAPVTLGATKTVPLVYDFYGFPQRYFDVKYAAPGAPELAQRLHALLDGTPSGPVVDSDRGLDHGAYVPLVAMYPEADVPVLQMSIPTMEPKTLLALGRALAPLRREGILVVGSGFLTHNMHAIDFAGAKAVPAWASEFDAWSKDALERRDVDALANYRERAPGVRTALPTHEHFVPVLVSTGASIDDPEPVSFPIAGFTYGSFTKRSVQFG
jgi:4,5-DOPA dioxygenase extradiol